MEAYYFKEFFNKSPTACSYYIVIQNDHGTPSDSKFLAINKSMENIFILLSEIEQKSALKKKSNPIDQGFVKEK